VEDDEFLGFRFRERRRR